MKDNNINRQFGKLPRKVKKALRQLKVTRTLSPAPDMEIGAWRIGKPIFEVQGKKTKYTHRAEVVITKELYKADRQLGAAILKEVFTLKLQKNCPPPPFIDPYI